MEKSYAVQSSLPNTLTLLPTYQCTAECEDCCFHSSPRIKKRIPQDRLLRYVDEAAEFPGMTLVVVSGGEPFLLRRDLVELVQRITARGLFSRIVSNGYWAVNEAGALAALRPLVAAGLREMSYSTGDDHARFVPLDRVMIAMDAALQLGLGVSLMIEERAGGKITRNAVLETAQRFPEVYRAIKQKSVQLLESPWMKFSDSPTQPTWSPFVMLRSSSLSARQTCTSVLASIVVTPDEKLGMCCGLPREDIADLNVGDLRVESMTSLYARHVHDILKIWLCVEGPERILAWATTKDPSIEWEDKYAHTCDACRAVYGDQRVLDAVHKYGTEKFDELMSVLALHGIAPMAPGHARRDIAPLIATTAGTTRVAEASIFKRRSDGTVERISPA